MTNLKYEIRSDDARDASVARVDMKLEVIVIPVSDVDRAKEFYKKLGWRLDLTPPGVVQLHRRAPAARSSLHEPHVGCARFSQGVPDRFQR